MSVIGKIVKSNSHTDYICQIYGPGEVEAPPIRESFAFGTFVCAPLGNGDSLVGIIYDTVLLNPELGRLGPRLSPEADLAVFSPDYLNEKVTLVGIVAVGILNQTGPATQGVPHLSVNSDVLVERMADDQIRAFHQGNPSPQIAYAPVLLSQGSPLAPYLLRNVINQLTILFPGKKTELYVLETDLTWKSQIGPLGGLQ